MEYKRIYLPFGLYFHRMRMMPVDNELTAKKDEEISKHLKDGWRIVSTSPSTGCEVIDGVSRTYTVGIEVFLVKE